MDYSKQYSLCGIKDQPSIHAKTTNLCKPKIYNMRNRFKTCVKTCKRHLSINKGDQFLSRHPP